MSLFSKAIQYIKQNLIGCRTCGRKMSDGLCWNCDEDDLYDHGYNPTR